MAHDDDLLITTDPRPFALPSSVWLWVLQFVVSAMLIYGAVNARVSVVEAKQSENERRLQRIEDKVDHLIELTQQHRP